MSRKYIDYKIVQAFKLIIESYVGDVTVMDIIKNKKRITEVEGYKADYNLILDFRDANLQINKTELDRLVVYFKENHIYHKEKRVAYLTDKPNEVVVTTLFASKIKEIPIHPEVFSTVEAVAGYMNMVDSEMFKLKIMLNELKTLPNKSS